MSLTIFANFRMDSEERLLRMKDSFESFKDATIERWVINARGPYKKQAMIFLEERLGEKLVAFELESGKGWFHDSRQMFPHMTTEFVLFWIEDHICMQSAVELDSVVSDMSESSSDYLLYSWFSHGLVLSTFDVVPKNELKSLFWLDYGKKENCLRQEKSIKVFGAPNYLISACGIFSDRLFKKIVSKRDPLYRRWPKETPFDFEKKGTDVHWLPFRLAIPKKELFAPIDDDNGVEGSSLQSRGLYPKRVLRSETKEVSGVDKNKKSLYTRLKNVRIIRRAFDKSKLMQKTLDVIRRLIYQF